MKKIIAVWLAILMTVSLAACTSAPQSQQTPQTTLQEATQQETTGSEPMPESYAALLSAVVSVFPKVSSLAEYQGLSDMYDGHTEKTEIGYALADIDGDGTQELLLKSMESPFIYDAFTLVNGELKQLFSGGENDSYRLYEEGYIEQQWTQGENIRGTDYFRVENQELVLFDRVVMDVEEAFARGRVDAVESADSNACFFRSATADKKDYVEITAMEALQLQQSFGEDNYQLYPVFTALSEYEG